MEETRKTGPEPDTLIERCERLFMRYGIKSVTMDDVSRELGISKKTLYQHFQNKDELIQKVTENHFTCQRQEMESIIHHSASAIEELLRIASWMHAMSKNLNPGLVFDLRKYHPSAWQVFNEHRYTHILNTMRHNLERGKNEGLYREDADVEILARIYIARVEMFIDNEVFPYDKFPPEKTYHVFMDYHIRGIATPKGIKLYEKIKSQNDGI
ncbi:MAG: TetR/AcrR family transcriptional regulator [Chitinophagales bacterium]